MKTLCLIPFILNIEFFKDEKMVCESSHTLKDQVLLPNMACRTYRYTESQKGNFEHIK